MSWGKFQRGVAVDIPGQRARLAEELAEQTGLPVEQVMDRIEATIDETARDTEIYFNNLYVVLLRRFYSSEMNCKMVYLSLRRQDRRPVRNWGHLQRIKNELVGEQYQAIEVFPPHTLKIDACNQYHLWVFEEVGRGVPVDLNMDL